MKRSRFIMLLVIIVMLAASANADSARFLNQDQNSAYHSEHLSLHIGSKNCKVSGNYIKVRPEAGSGKVIGHLEPADTFTLDEITGGWAKITVTRASKRSRDSHNGLTGWVDADYIECPCSSDEYYGGFAHTTYSIGTAINSNVKLRAEPSKVSAQFARLKKGDQVEILSEYTGKDKATWYRCRFDGKMGYIRSDMLDITERDIREEGVVSLTAMNDQTENVITHSETQAQEADRDDSMFMAEADQSDDTPRTDDGTVVLSDPETAASGVQEEGNALDGYYEYEDSYAYGQLIGDYIPVKVYADKTVYRAGEPITFSADILGGTPPFAVRWRVEESQTRDAPTPLDLYMEGHDEFVSHASYATNDRHVEFVFVPPVNSDDLFGMFSVIDAKGVSNISPDEDCAAVEPALARDGMPADGQPLSAGETVSQGEGTGDPNGSDDTGLSDVPETQAAVMSQEIHLEDQPVDASSVQERSLFTIQGEELDAMPVGTVLARITFSPAGKAVISKPELPERLAKRLKERNEVYFLEQTETGSSLHTNMLIVFKKADSCPVVYGYSFRQGANEFIGLGYSCRWWHLSWSSTYFSGLALNISDTNNFSLCEDSEPNMYSQVSETYFPIPEKYLEMLLSYL